MAIDYRVNAHIDLEQLGRLFRQQPWTCDRTAARVARMLEHTALHVSAYDGRLLVGFARAVTDRVYRAIIDDVVATTWFEGAGCQVVIRRLEQP